MNTPAKIPFIDVYRQSLIGYETLITEGEKQARIPRSTIDNMIVGNPVSVPDAASVLALLTRWTDHAYTLDNVEIALLPPTLQDLYVSRGFNILSLSQESGVPLTVINRMLRDEPVSREDALRILQALSEQIGQSYTLDAVSVKLSVASLLRKGDE